MSDHADRVNVVRADAVVDALGLRSFVDFFGKMAVLGQAMQDGDKVAARIKIVCADPNSSLEDCFNAIKQEEPLSTFAVLALAMGSAALERKIAEAQRDRGAAGGRARASRFQPVKDHAYSLVKNEAPPSGQWASRNAAVQAIKDRVMNFARENSFQLAEGNAARTIDGWLSQHPDADTLFRRQKKSAG